MLDVKALLTKILSRFGSDNTYVSASGTITGGLRLIKDKSTGTVRAYGYFRKTSNITTTETIFQVPSGWRPTTTWEIPMYLYVDGGTSASYFGSINSNGVVNQNLGSVIRGGFTAFEYTYE